MPWIHHPSQGCPVSVWRWLIFHIGEWMQKHGSRMSERALYPDRCQECGNRVRVGEVCDHIPF